MQTHFYEDDVSLAHVLRDAVDRPCSSFLGDNTRFLSGDADCQICQHPVDAVFAAVQIGLRARRWPVGACEIFNRQN